MKDQERCVREFMQLADQATPIIPMVPPDDVLELRVRLITEELEEFKLAVDARDLVGMADALADLLYVVHGSNVACGIDGNAVFMLVHENNMQKFLRGHKDAGGKWIKPDDHQPPNILGELLRQTQER